MSKFISSDGYGYVLSDVVNKDGNDYVLLENTNRLHKIYYTSEYGLDVASAYIKINGLQYYLDEFIRTDL